MLSMVVAAMFSKASRVKKAWWPVTITFGNVSSRANTSSRNDQTGTIFEKDFFFLFVNVEPEITDLAALQRFDHCDSIEQCAATGVDEHDAVLILSIARAESIMCLFSGVSGQCSVMMSD